MITVLPPIASHSQIGPMSGGVAGGGVAVKKEEGSEGEEEMDIGEDEVR